MLIVSASYRKSTFLLAISEFSATTAQQRDKTSATEVRARARSGVMRVGSTPELERLEAFDSPHRLAHGQSSRAADRVLPAPDNQPHGIRIKVRTRCDATRRLHAAPTSSSRGRPDLRPSCDSRQPKNRRAIVPRIAARLYSAPQSAHHHRPYLQFCLQQIKLTSSSNKELAKAYNVIHFCSKDVLTGSSQCGRLHRWREVGFEPPTQGTQRHQATCSARREFSRSARQSLSPQPWNRTAKTAPARRRPRKRVGPCWQARGLDGFSAAHPRSRVSRPASCATPCATARAPTSPISLPLRSRASAPYALAQGIAF